MEKRQPQGLTTYAYDSMNRLSVVGHPGGKEELFYDRAGNRTRRIQDGEEELYRYDSRNRLTEHTRGGVTRKYQYDNAGNLLEDGRARYEYDAFNRNTKVEPLDGNIQVNRYDAEGLRHEMGERKEAALTGQGNGSALTGEWKESVLTGQDNGSALAGQGNKPAESGEVPENSILNRYEYDAWGNLTVCEETVPNRFRFNGQQYDPITQQCYLRARYYNPVIGRFTQEDTYRGDGLNLYAYCRNNPVCYVDPSGHAVISCERAQENMLMARDAGQRIQDIDTKTANQLKRWYQFKENHNLLTPEERRLAGQIGLDVECSRYSGTGEHSEVGGHHIHAKAGFRGDMNYDPQKGFSISQEFMENNGLNHQAMTAKQRELFKELYESGRPNTLAEHTRIAEEALRAGGASESMIQKLIQDSLDNLAEQGVNAPTRIPWYSK